MSHYHEMVQSIPGNWYGVGGQGGNEFRLFIEDTVVRRLTVFTSDKKKILRGMIVEFSNGESQQVGTVTSENKSFSFSNGARLQNIVIAEARDNTRVGYLWFRTEHDGDMEVGDRNGRKAYEFQVHGRVLLGFQGRAGSDIDRLSAIVSKKFISSELTDVTYDDYELELPVRPDSIRQVFQDSVDNRNGSVPATMIRKITKIKESTITHTSSKTTHMKHHLGVATRFMGGIPFVTEAEAALSYDFKYGISNETSEVEARRDTESVEVETKTTIPAGKRVQVTTVQVQENLDLPYTGTLRVRYEGDPNEYVTDIRGKLQGVLVSGIQTKIDER